MQKELNNQDQDISPEGTIGELVVRHPQLKACLEKMGIDYCCGGKKPLGVAAELAGLEWSEVLATLQMALLSEYKSADNKDWNNSPLSVLADHIVSKHHAFTKEQLIRLDGLLTRVQRAHAAQHGAMLNHMRREYDPLRAELDEHLLKEEQILFPLIKGIDAFVSGNGIKPVMHCGSIANIIKQMDHEHESAGNALVEIRRLTDGYQLPEDSCQTFAALYDGLQALESDLHEHIHLESNILFPKSIAQEKEMLSKDK